MKKYWKNEYEYRRILEILDAYWLTEQDEACVIVRLDFLKGDGQRQGKDILWVNPNPSKEYSVNINKFIKEILK